MQLCYWFVFLSLSVTPACLHALPLQLIAPGKVEIPERYVEYENVELTPAEEKMKHQKVAAIGKMLAKSG